MWPKVNDRRNVPKVEGAITRCPSTSWVRAVRSTSASSITSPPATIACSRVSTLRPGRWWPGRSPRSTSSSTTASTPSRSASVAVSARPALATAWWSSKATTRALGVCDDGIEKVPSEWGCMAGSQPPFSQLKGPFHNHSTAHATRRGGGSRLKAKATAIGQAVPDRQSLVRMIYEWEAGTHRPRAYYVLFVLVYATEEKLATRTIKRGSELHRLMAALKAMGVPVNRRQFLLNAAALAGGVAGLPTVAVNLDGQERLTWVLKHPRSVDLPTVAYLRTRTFDLMKQYEAVASPTSLLSQTAERLEQITLLREHAPLGRVQQELWRVETQSATLLGRLTWDVSGQRDHATAAPTTTRPSPPPTTSRKA